MDLQIVEKGTSFNIKTKEGAAIQKLYVGAGWNMNGSQAVDLDLVAACLSNGKLTSQTRLVYFGDKEEPGVQLSPDNTTGEGDGDDESIVFDLTKVEPDVDSIAIGLCAYAGADLSSANSVHFRGVNGNSADGVEIFKAPMELATPEDTVLHAVTLNRTQDGWTVVNVGKFYKKGKAAESIKGFAGLFAA